MLDIYQQNDEVVISDDANYQYAGQIEGRHIKAESKFLWPWRYNNLFSLASAVDPDDFQVTTTTRTVYSTTTVSTATVASIQKCLASGQFKAGSAAISCRRRRRAVDVEEQQQAASEDAIDPKEVLP